MTSTTRTSSKFRRYTASVVATAAVAVAGVACGTDTVADLEPAAPAQVKVNQPQSAPNLAKERHEALKRHYLPPADSHKAAERTIEKEQEVLKQQDPSPRFMGRPGPGF